MYDVIILGGGPAGLCAGIYAKRAMLNCVVVEKFLLVQVKLPKANVLITIWAYWVKVVLNLEINSEITQKLRCRILYR